MTRSFLFLAAAVAGLSLPACDRKDEPLPDGGALVKAVRVGISEHRHAADISPYDESLVWHEYDVKEVLEGQLKEPRIRVGHWGVIRGKDVPVDGELGKEVQLRVRPFDEDDQANLTDVVICDDLDIVEKEPPRFMDMQTIMAHGLTPEAVRYDYDTVFSGQMKLYWELRPQLELVILGNSHAAKGIRPDILLDEQNKETPKALNLGAGGANIDLQCLLAREYLVDLPKLKTVIWVVNARIFNADLKGADRRFEVFLNSPGHDYDKENQKDLWPVKTDGPPVTVTQLKNIEQTVEKTDVWGWSARDRVMKPEARAEMIKDLNKPNFSFDDNALELFEKTVGLLTAKGIKVFVLTSPIHPQSKDTKAADPDGSTHEGMKLMVKKLTEFDTAQPMVWFKDYNQNGHHGIDDSLFYDVDHLNADGGTMFTQKVIEWMNSTQGAAGVPETAAPAK